MAEDFDRLIGAIDAAEENSYGGEDDLANERATAIDYYLGKNVEPAPDGRSQVVDRSVYETIQWIMPSLSRIFASGDDVVQLPPVGPEDEEGAKQEAQYLNFVVLQKNNWFDLFNTAAKDALLNKAGYLYPYREKRRQVEIERYERQTAAGLALILQDGPDVLSHKEYPDPEAQPTPVVDPQTGQPAVGPDGQPVMQPPAMLYDIEIRRTKEEIKYCILCLPPERCRIAKTTNTVQLRDCSYFEYWDYPTISDLRGEGYEIEDDIGTGMDDTTPEDDARDQYSESAWSDDNRGDPAMRRVKCRWIWIQHDHDEDGIAERNYCVRVGHKILYREEVSRIPVAVLCADPLPHRHVGQGIADITVDIQRIKTVILRQALDNLQLSNNPKTYLNPGMVNLDDMLVSRPGGIVRGKGQFGVDIAPMPVPFVFPQAMEGLEYMDQVRENRTGTNRYFTGIDQNALNKTATGIQQLSTMAAQRVEQIARHFANGIEELFSILHEVILKGGHQSDIIKLRGKWVEVNPAEWRRRTDFRISVGYAAGNKDAMVSRLMMIAQMQEKALIGGLPIANAQNAYETAIELTKASDFATPERFWTDPAQAPPPPPPQPDITVMAAERLKAETEIKVKGAELAQQDQESAREDATKRYEIETRAQVDLLVANSRTEQQREQLGHQKEMERLKLDGSLETEQVRALFNPKLLESQAREKDGGKLDQLLQQVAALQKAVESLQGGAA